MKIDSQQNFSVASKQATNKKSQIESPGASSFDDLLKGAKLKERPKAAKPEDKPAVEVKKPAAGAKKTSGQKKRADQTNECDTADQTAEASVAENQKSKPAGDKTLHRTPMLKLRSKQLRKTKQRHQLRQL